MRAKLLFLLLVPFFASLFAADADAQTARKAVGAAEASGTFRDYFSGKFKGNYNEIRILALGKGKLRVRFDLTYPYLDASGEMTANVGEADGTATIEGDTATFSPADTDGCTITIKFVKPGAIKVTQNGASECGFGFNVSASGDYKKTSAAKPKFDD
jgi:hypothetical protein